MQYLFSIKKISLSRKKNWVMERSSIEKNEFNFLSQPSKLFNKDSLFDFSSIKPSESQSISQNIYDQRAQQIKDNIDILKGMKKFREYNKRRKNHSRKFSKNTNSKSPAKLVPKNPTKPDKSRREGNRSDDPSSEDFLKADK